MCAVAQVPTALADKAAIQIALQEGSQDKDECEGEGQPRYCKRAHFTLAASFNPDDQFVVGATARNNRLFGSKHRLSLGAQISERHQEFRTDYDVPTLFDSEVDLHFEAFAKQTAFGNFEREKVGGAMRLSSALSPHLKASVGYRFQHIESNALPLRGPDGGFVHGSTNESGILAALEVGLNFDNRNSKRMGSTASLFASQADTRFGSDYQLTKLSASFTHRAPLVGPLSLSLRGHGQALLSRDGSAIPLAERLQWSGHSNVRGYGLGSTGPMYGGDIKAGGQAELEFPLISAWRLSGVLFYDAGFVDNRYRLGKSPFELRQSVGLGLRWNSPIGPIALDFARPLDDPQASPSLLLSIGNSF